MRFNIFTDTKYAVYMLGNEAYSAAELAVVDSLDDAIIEANAYMRNHYAMVRGYHVIDWFTGELLYECYKR